MALYSKKTALSHIEYLADGVGTLSKSSYLLGEVTGVTASDGSTKATVKYSLYGSSSKKRTVQAEIYAGGKTASKSVTITTSMSCLLTTTVTMDCYYEIKDIVSASLSYSEKKSGGIIGSYYGITTNADITTPTTFSFVTFGTLSSHPSKMVYGKNGTFQFSKSSAYKLEFYDPDDVLRYTTTFTGTSANITVPTSVFKDCGKNLTHFTFYEMNGDTAIFRDTYSVTVAETACALTLVAYRFGTSDNPDNVTLLVYGQSASVSESRTITFYAKETSATEWTKLSESLSPSSAAFSDCCEVSLSIDYAWDIYGAIEDGYTKAQSTKVRIFSKYYIMDIRTDGTGVAFGGTAANKDELYCGFKNFRADNITANGGVYDVSGNLRTAINDKAAASHTHTASDITDLAKRFQAGNVLMTPGAETVTYNGIKYYKAIAKITFGTEFDEAPEVVIAPTTAAPYRMFVAPANVTATGFTINFFRDSKTATGIHWIAMPRTQ